MLNVRDVFNETAKPESVKRVIVHNARQLNEVVAEALEALVDANDPPTLFVRGGQLVRLRADEDDRPLIEPLRPEHVRMHLAQAATWWRAKADGHTATSPPMEVCNGVLAAKGWELPALAGVVESPVLRADGTFHTEHGYDPSTRLYFWQTGRPIPRVMSAPSYEQQQSAVALVDEMLCDFPWDTTADRANAWGLLLTPLVRPIVAQVPMALIDAPEPGTGKSLLADVITAIAAGRPGAKMTLPSNEEEIEKRLTAALMAGSTSMIFDNVDGMIRSANLAAVLTTDSWQGRMLGASTMVTVPNRATWMATGNNLDVGGDLARRCYRIKLDARQASPWTRTGFRHTELLDWVLEQRPQLLHALCVVVRSWHVAGRPLAPSAMAMGGYSGWVRVVGGILHHAGVPGFLDNLTAFHAEADREAQQWEAFLAAWSDGWGDVAQTVADLVRSMNSESTYGNALRDALPDDLSGYYATSGFTRRVGHALRKRSGRHYGADGLHLVEMPRDSTRNVAAYSVTARSGAVTASVRSEVSAEHSPNADAAPKPEEIF